MPPGGKGTKLDAKWQLNAALLSRPVDLSALVSLSRQHPLEFFKDDTLHRMVKTLLNETNEKKSDKDTKLDVLTILGSLASVEKDEVRDEIKVALGGVSEWFDEYVVASPLLLLLLHPRAAAATAARPAYTTTAAAAAPAITSTL